VVALVSADSESPRSFGSVDRLVKQHDFAPKVTLAQVLEQPHAYGLGSLSDLRGEITIVDGKVWLAFPPPRDVTPAPAPRVVTEGAAAEKAGFLVAAHVAPDGWTKVQLTDPLSSKDVDSLLARAARAHGLDDRELVFRVKGTLEKLTLAIIDGRRVPPGPGSEATMETANVLQRVTPGADVELVGFYSPAAESSFTHAGQHAHVHAVVPREHATGHAEEFVLRPGAMLWLQGTTAMARAE
jgi:acetolactate decarboxylase